MKFKKTLVLLTVLALSLGYSVQGAAAKYDDIVKKARKSAQGVVNLYLGGDGKVMMELPLSLVGREFVMGSTIRSISDNQIGVVGSKPSRLVHFTFTMADSTVMMRFVDADLYTRDANIASALSLSHTGEIFQKMEAKAWNPDSSAAVIDVTDIFLSHDENMSPISEYGAYKSAYSIEESFKKDLSYIADVKSYEDNFSVTSSMSYTYSLTKGGKKVRKDAPMTAELTRSVLLLPEQIYHPRMADPRIGVFHSQRTEYQGFGQGSKPLYLANRWRLEPSDTASYRAGQKVDPVKPIVFYVDDNFPEWWKPYIREGIEQWQELFEEIGFSHAIVARDFPKDDPSFDPENLKYSCVRYAPIGIKNAMGPSWTDPRSGEIINASVYVYHDIVKLISNWRFIQTSQADEAVRSCVLPQEILGDAIRYVISHEIGHTLGFMHNMSASAVIPVESLRDPEATAKDGTTTSIMDYARFNYVAQPGDKERGVKLTPPRFGEYDHWLIRWTYTPVFDQPDFESEAKVTAGWITDAITSNPRLRYGKQQFSSGLFDPRCQNEDLGDNSVAATKYGVKSLKFITSNFMEWLSEGDEDYTRRTEIYQGILNQYLAYAQHVVLNVGGLYKNEVYEGDTLPQYQNIPREHQIEALNYMFALLEDLDWIDDASVVGHLPIVGKPSAAVSDALQDLILVAPANCGLADGIDTDEFSAVECIRMISEKVWAPSLKGHALTYADKQIQHKFIASMIATGSFASVNTKKDSFADIAGESDAISDRYDENPVFLGELTYNPVAGFEWTPRTTGLVNKITRADCYAALIKSLDAARKALRKCPECDKGHYMDIICKLEYALR